VLAAEQMSKESKNYNYWKIWAASLAVLIILKFLFGSKLDEDALFFLFSLYIVPVWLWVMYLNFKKGRDLISYLKEHHHSKWEEITYVPFYGPGGVNSFRSLPFVFSRDHLNDDKVRVLKKSYISFMKFALTVFISIIPLFLMVMLKW